MTDIRAGRAVRDDLVRQIAAPTRAQTTPPQFIGAWRMFGPGIAVLFKIVCAFEERVGALFRALPTDEIRQSCAEA
jgi:hypothetical protein